MAQKVSREGLTLDAELINPFIRAIQNVLQKETKSQVLRTGKPSLTSGGELAHEITSVIGLVGEVSGVFLISVSAEYAFSFFREVVGVEATEIDEVVLSGIAELSNTIAGQAAIALEEIGLTTDISPPPPDQGQGCQPVHPGPPPRLRSPQDRSGRPSHGSRRCQVSEIGSNFRPEIPPSR